MQKKKEKQHAEKEGKAACRRKSNVVCMQTGLTMIRVRVFDNIVMTIRQYSSINKYLGCLGWGFESS
jgi:hypothetical protein